MMRLVSSFDENTLDLLHHSWLDSVPHSKQCAHTYTHTANPVHVMKSPLLAEEFVHGSRVYLDIVKPYQIFGNTPDRASLIVSIRRAAGKKKTVGWIGGHAGTSNRKNKTTHQPSCCSQPPPMYTSLSCTNTMPLGTVMFSRSYYSDYSSGHKRHTDTHCLFKLYSPIRHEIKTRFHQSRSTLVS